MNWNKLTYLLIIIASFLLVYIIGYNIGIKKGKDQLKLDYYENMTVLTDTVTILDTVYYPKPEVKYITKLQERIDTIIKVDSIEVPISLPLVEKEYAGTDYKATVKGIEMGKYPSLENIEIYQKEKYITETKFVSERKRWGFNITGGIGYGYNPISKRIEPNIGIVIGYGYTFSR